MPTNCSFWLVKAVVKTILITIVDNLLSTRKWPWHQIKWQSCFSMRAGTVATFSLPCLFQLQTKRHWEAPSQMQQCDDSGRQWRWGGWSLKVGSQLIACSWGLRGPLSYEKALETGNHHSRSRNPRLFTRLEWKGPKLMTKKPQNVLDMTRPRSIWTRILRIKRTKTTKQQTASPARRKGISYPTEKKMEQFVFQGSPH